MGKTVTKAVMAAELDVLRRHCDELSTKCDALALENEELRSQVARLKAAPADELVEQLRADLHRAELERSGLAILIEYWAGLNTSTSVNVDHGTFLDMARAGFKARFEAKADGMGLVTSSPSERVRVLPQRTRIVHEFDPELPGDYLRAMQRARELGGVVRRKQ